MEGWWWVTEESGESEEDKGREVSTVGSEESWSVRGRLQMYAYLSAWVCVNTSAV